MPVNIVPNFIATPRIGTPTLFATNNAQVASDGTSAGGTNSATDKMYQIFASGANGSFVERVKFMSTSSNSVGSITSVATTLRVYYSTSTGNNNATTSANTFLLGEIAAPAVLSSNTVTPTPVYEIILNLNMPANSYLLASQATSQGAAGANGIYQAWAWNCGDF